MTALAVIFVCRFEVALLLRSRGHVERGGFSYQSSLGPFPRPVSHTGSFRGPSDIRRHSDSDFARFGRAQPHMSLGTRCPYCGLLVQTPHENDAACVAALREEAEMPEDQVCARITESRHH